MNTKTPPTEPLDEQERELARVVRAFAGGEPPPALDARILKAAANAAAATQEPRVRWPASPRMLWSLGSTAAAVLAVGIGWQMFRPMPHSLPVQAPSAPHIPAAEQSSTKQSSIRQFSTPAELEDTTARESDNVAPPPLAARTVAPEIRQRSLGKTAPSPAPAAAAPVVPATPQTLASPEPFAQQQRDEQGSAAARSRVSAEASADRPATAAAENTATMARAAQTRTAAERSTGSIAADASADHARAFRQTPAAWLEHIRQLHRQGRADEARASLVEFGQQYPRYEIPADLAVLLHE